MKSYRVVFSKEGRAKYVAHLDLMRAFERSFRRAGLPIALSQGFNPHPKFNFAAPAPVGLTGREEYLELELRSEVPSAELKNKLNQVLPPGLRINKVKQIMSKTLSLMAQVSSAEYLIVCEILGNLSGEKLKECLNNYLGLEQIIISKNNKGKEETKKDIRQGIYRLEGWLEGQKLKLIMELQIGSFGNVKPEDVLNSLLKNCGFEVDRESIETERTGLFTYKDGKPVALWDC